MIEAQQEGENEKFDPSRTEPARLMTWPSTIDSIDFHCGGFYGMVCVGAARGTGKTLLALSSALSAAADGWQVCYFAAEDDMDGLSVRFNNYMNSHPEQEPGIDNFHLFQTARGQTPKSLTEEVAGAIDIESDAPVLTVIDSLNSLVEMSRYSYFEGLSEFGLWAMLARRYSGGAASFLLISEVNSRGSIKAEKLPYLCDQVLVMQRGSGSDIVEMELQKSRRTPGVGELGKFVRAWNEGVFLSESQVDDRKLRVVQGGNQSEDRMTPETGNLF